MIKGGLRNWYVRACGPDDHDPSAVGFYRPAFRRDARRIPGRHLHPFEKAAVVRIGESSPVQALDHTQPMLPGRPGQTERRTHDCVRRSTLRLFAGVVTNAEAETELKAGTIERDAHAQMPAHSSVVEATRKVASSL